MSETITKKDLSAAKRKAKVEELVEMFKGMEKPKTYFENLYINQVDKATIAAYMKACATDKDKAWFNSKGEDGFRTLAYPDKDIKQRVVLETPETKTVKHGLVETTKTKKYKFDGDVIDTKPVYDRIKAAQAFADHFKITYKKPTEYDEFADI